MLREISTLQGGSDLARTTSPMASSGRQPNLGSHLSLWRQAIGADARVLPVRQEDIAARAYAKYLERQDWRGALDQWLEAERELRCEMLARMASTPDPEK